MGICEVGAQGHVLCVRVSLPLCVYVREGHAHLCAPLSTPLHPSPPLLSPLPQVLAVRAQLQKLRDDKKAALDPFIAASSEVDAQAAKLRAKRAELLKELEGACVLTCTL